MKKMRGIDRTIRIILFILMSVFSFTFLYMFYWLITNSLKSPYDYLEKPFSVFGSHGITFEGYRTFFIHKEGRRGTNMFGMIANALILYGFGFLTGIMLPALTGYATAKFKTKIQTLFVTLTYIMMCVLIVGTESVRYKFMHDINLYDTFAGIILMGASGLGFYYLMVRNFFAAIPWDYAESARMDGANNFRIFFSIMLPQAVPIITGLAVISFIATWNDYYTAYMYLPSHPTVALGVNNIYNTLAMKKQDFPAAFASMTFLVMIVLIPYLFCSKVIMQSMSVGGLKG